MMRKYSFLLLGLLFSLSSAWAQEDFRKMAPAPGEAPKLELGSYETFTLDNGLQVIVVENHKLPRVSFQLFVDVPLHLENDAAGTADMTGTLLRAGTTERTKAELDEAIDFIGASISTDANGVSGSSLSRYTDDLLALMSEILLSPSFPEAEIEKNKTQTLSGLATVKDDPNSIAGNVASVLRYGTDHPYGQITTEETVNKIDADKIKAYYQTYFKPNISYLVMVGDIDLGQARAKADEFFGAWEKGEVEKATFDRPIRPKATQLSMVNRPTAVQSVINITYPVLLRPGTPDQIYGAVLNMILGSSFNGRLFANLREDKGYTYGAYSQLSNNPNVGYFNASASVRNEVTDSALVEFMYELNRISTEKVTDEELRRAKSMITGNFARGLESPQTIAQFALNTARYGLDRDFYATYLQRLAKVTPADILETAHRYITPDRAHIVVVGNKGEIAEKIARFDTDGEIDYYDAFGNEEVAVTATIPEGMTAQDVIDNYIAARGGKEAMMEVKDISQMSSAEVQGMKMEMTVKQKDGDKMMLAINANGMSMQEMVLNGDKVKVIAMGQEQEIPEEQIDGMKSQATVFPELEPVAEDCTNELTGIENVEQEACYVIEKNCGDESKTVSYYSIATGLMMRSITNAAGQEVITDYSEYQLVDGIMFPHVTTSSGMAPFPITFTVESIEINKGLDDSLFEIE